MVINSRKLIKNSGNNWKKHHTRERSNTHGASQRMNGDAVGTQLFPCNVNVTSPRLNVPVCSPRSRELALLDVYDWRFINWQWSWEIKMPRRASGAAATHQERTEQKSMEQLSFLYIRRRQQKSRKARGENPGCIWVFCYPHWLSRVCVCCRYSSSCGDMNLFYTVTSRWLVSSRWTRSRNTYRKRTSALCKSFKSYNLFFWGGTKCEGVENVMSSEVKETHLCV